jgi:hypothetical protein
MSPEHVQVVAGPAPGPGAQPPCPSRAPVFDWDEPRTTVPGRQGRRVPAGTGRGAAWTGVHTIASDDEVPFLLAG